MLTRAIPSMFHRRLLLLGVLSAAGMAVVLGQAARLTLLKHAELKARAEGKLIARHWTPTVRGRILDRKGRVLAEDAASYDLTLPFRVVDGEWASRRAREQAPRKYKGAWGGWTPAERAEVVVRMTAVYEQHQAEAWDRLARLLGTGPAELAARRAEIVERVRRRYDAVVAMRRAKEVRKAQDAKGEPLSEAEVREIEKRVNEPIWEQGATHTIAARLSDAMAMELDRFCGVEVEIVLESAGAGAAGGAAVVDRVEAIPGLRIENSGDRVYPMETVEVEVDTSHLPGPLRKPGSARVEVDGVAVHVVGWMREGVQDEDVLRRRGALEQSAEAAARVRNEEGEDRGFYDATAIERVGAAGVEQSMESELRGLRGEKIRKLDTGSSRTLEATHGRDVRLTIDAVLQARIQAVMTPGAGGLGLAQVQPWNQSPETVMGADGQPKPNPAHRPVGTPLNGAAVVLDIDAGEVLAMVSTPTFLRSELGAEGSRVFDMAAGGAFLNRAIARPYPPGSVAKALILNGAAQRGAYKAGDTVDCTGHLFPNQPNALRCWIYKMTQNTGAPQTHTGQLGHPLRGAEGLMVSCNVFFFTMGQRLGVEGVEATYREFGVGRGWDLGIGWEFPGVVEKPAKYGPMTIQDAIMMGIGQGPVAWTPMHAANAYATLARKGVWVKPRIIMDRPMERPTTLGLVPAAADEALEGLGLAVNAELGSGHHISINGAHETTFDHDPARVWIWGKTGTAAGSDTFDPDGKEGPAAPETVVGDHSWYVVLAGAAADQRPRYAVAVLMEYAGSGGKVSGPICNQILHAMAAEGYLPASAKAAEGGGP